MQYVVFLRLNAQARCLEEDGHNLEPRSLKKVHYISAVNLETATSPFALEIYQSCDFAQLQGSGRRR